jgi:hypothetical protein
MCLPSAEIGGPGEMKDGRIDGASYEFLAAFQSTLDFIPCMSANFSAVTCARGPANLGW